MKNIFMVFDGEYPVAVSADKHEAMLMLNEYEMAVGSDDCDVWMHEVELGSHIGEIDDNMLYKQTVK